VCLGLVSAWAQYNPSIQNKFEEEAGLDRFLYLGIPNWTNSVFAWHVVLLVAGYFLSQVLSLTSIVVFGNKTHAVLAHVFWQLAALTTLIAGMRAIVKYKDHIHQDSLNTFHGWVGVVTIVMFFFSFVFSNGVSVAALVFKSNLSAGTTWVHMAFSIITLVLTFFAIITGVEAHNGFNGCAFIHLSESAQDKTILNSAFYYGAHYPWACKLSNGLGICAMFGTFFTVVALAASSSVALFDTKDATESADDDAKGIELGSSIEVAGGEDNTA